MIAGSLRAAAPPAALPEAWRWVQTVDIDGAGLVKMSIPLPTLDAARAGLEDLRLLDADGKEVPYLIERPVQSVATIFPVRSFEARIRGDTTIITLETGQSQPVEELILETPARHFVTSARIEASGDGATWRPIQTEEPIFDYPDGARRLGIRFPPGVWKQLRVTVSNRPSAIAFTGAKVRVTAPETAPAVPYGVEIREREEFGDRTRFVLRAEGAHATLADVEIIAADLLFTRAVTLACQNVVEGEVREVSLAPGTIYRVEIPGQPASSNLVFAMDAAVPARELILTVQNGSSPPLNVTSIRARRRPVYLSWLLVRPGVHYLLCGNAACPAPRYDLAAMPSAAKGTLAVPRLVSALASNGNFHAKEVLPEAAVEGTTLEVAKWGFRKRVTLTGPGIQQLELDLETLAGSGPALRDVRLVQNGKQVPFVIERASLTRRIPLTAERKDDPKRTTVSHWVVKLPFAALPIQQIHCESDAPYFKRNAALSEQVPDERGNRYQAHLGEVAWVRDLNQEKTPLPIPVQGGLRTDTLALDVENGDNPPLALSHFTASYAVVRLMFQASGNSDLWLYYGNPDAGSPRYDIDLIAAQLLSAEKQKPTLAVAEVLKAGLRSRPPAAGAQNFILWGVLGLAVIVMLVIISRLLPKPGGSGTGGNAGN